MIFTPLCGWYSQTMRNISNAILFLHVLLPLSVSFYNWPFLFFFLFLLVNFVRVNLIKSMKYYLNILNSERCHGILKCDKHFGCHKSICQPLCSSFFPLRVSCVHYVPHEYPVGSMSITTSYWIVNIFRTFFFFYI